MKRLLIFVIVMGAAFHCHAQDNDDFESFRSGLMDGFQSFRQEVLTGYTDFLRTAWEDFNVFRSESRDSKPKPRTAPTANDTGTAGKSSDTGSHSARSRPCTCRTQQHYA